MNGYPESDCLLPLTIIPLQLIVPVGRGFSAIGHPVKVVRRSKENVTALDTVYIRCAYILNPDVHIGSIISHLNNLNPALNAVA